MVSAPNFQLGNFTMGNDRAKPRQIKVMSNISGLLPLLHDFSPNRKQTSTKLHLNLTIVKKVDSIGLSILLGLIFLRKDHPEDYEVKITWSQDSDVNRILSNLGFYKIFESLCLTNMRNGSTLDLFSYLPTYQNSQISFFNDKNISDGLQELILFRRKPDINRQQTLDLFSRSLKAFMAREKPRTFNHEQIIKVFLELAKNTYDHSTSGVGIAGLYKSKDMSNLETLQFVYCDTGEGICQNVRNFLASSEFPDSQRFSKKGGAVDFLYKAFQAGFSTKHGNGVNHGMGLTLVTQGAIGCGFNVLLRDAESIIDLSGINDYTHEKMRESFFRTTAPKLLMFYFVREIKSEARNSK